MRLHAAEGVLDDPIGELAIRRRFANQQAEVTGCGVQQILSRLGWADMIGRAYRVAHYWTRLAISGEVAEGSVPQPSAYSTIHVAWPGGRPAPLRAPGGVALTPQDQ